jgi:uncharacterized protein (TIGR02246 family)
MTSTPGESCIDLPKPIAIYIAAENRGDPQAMAQCFTEDAVVRDEGRTMKGLAAIQQWKTNCLTGNFPGSPIELRFVFKVEGERIVSLQIHS